MANDPLQPSASNPSAASSDNALTPDASMAADLIRQKLELIYDAEPNAAAEAVEAADAAKRSPHQQFMYDLSTSGKDLASVQTEWHNYYQGLSSDQKHQVWHEFYAGQAAVTGKVQQETVAVNPHTVAKHKQQASKPVTRKSPVKSKPKKLRDVRSTKDVQAAIRDTVTAGGKLEPKHHVQSLLFGLGMGTIVVIIFLFSFFNEVVIAPFIQPSRVAAATPLIVSSNTVTASAQPQVIIPKINVQIPANYSEASTDENAIENDLESGIVHYPTTAVPGQNGNAAFFGHSSNNIFNKGRYKFAFVLLHTLVEGDTFYLTYNSKVYVYKVISRQIVEPSEVSVLNPVPGQTATATLITCDPPGTSLHRLVVVGQQISPDSGGNSQATAATTASTTNPRTALPGNGPTLWARFVRTAAGKGLLISLLSAILIIVMRRFNRVLRPAI